MTAEVAQLSSDLVETEDASPRRALPDPQGVHLALEFDAATAEALRATALVVANATKRPHTRRIEQVFWDTSDHRLGRSGIALAVQGTAQRRQQIVLPIRAVRTGGRSLAVSETPVQGTRPDLVRLALTPGTDAVLVSGLDPAAIIPVFALSLKRTQWTIVWGDSQFLLALDIGTIATSQGNGTIRQAGLTHIMGPVIGMYDFARALGRQVPFTLARLSPAQQGYRLIAGEDWWPHVAKPPLSPEMTVRDGILAIGQAATATLRMEIDALIGSLEPERIHQTRVAIRRLRSFLSVFGPVLPTLSRRILGRELNDLASQLGSAREWDVFLAETLAPMTESLPDERALATLRMTGAVLREQAAAGARAAVAEDYPDGQKASAAFMDLSLRLAAWFDAGIWPEAPSVDAASWLDRPLIALAEELLRKRHRKLLRIAHGLVDPRPEELHALRIEAKKLRYTAEFFARLYSGKNTKRYLTALAEIQDILGIINDVATCRGLVQKLCGGGQPADLHAAGLINGWTAAQAAAARRHFAESLTGFAAVKRFWKDD
jgi:CHAD domain-containing protein